MAVVIPLAAAAFTATAGMAAVATATTLGVLSGYAMVAGAVLTGVGALTGKKDLMKAGSILSLAGGVGSIANSASMASSQAAAASQSSALGGGGPLGTAGAEGMAGEALGQAAPQLSIGAPTGLISDAAGSAMQQAGSLGSSFGGRSLLDQAASSLNMSDITDFVTRTGQKAGQAAKGVGEFIKNNKELVNVAGGALDSMYGSDAELIDLNKRKFGYEKSLIDRAQTNLNNPVKLYNYGTKP